MFVNFTDSTQKNISDVFCGPQDETIYPNQGTVAASDARWAAYYAAVTPAMRVGLAVPTSAPPAPTLAQQATALIAAGLTIASTGTPAINGTYAVASGVPFGREDIGTEAQFISTFSEFTNGAQTLEWPLTNGTFVTFPSTAAYMNFAKAAAQFYAAAKAVVALNAGVLPAAAVTIA